MKRSGAQQGRRGFTLLLLAVLLLVSLALGSTQLRGPQGNREAWSGAGIRVAGTPPLQTRRSAGLPASSAPIAPPVAGRAPPPPGVLKVGAYLTTFDTLDLQNNTFEAQFYLWTLWSGPRQSNPEENNPEENNPSEQLTLLNDVYNSDTTQFEELARESRNGVQWTLYRVHARFLHRWKLNSYPFDRHVLRIKLGFRNPLQRDIELQADRSDSGASPDLYLYGWRVGEFGISSSTMNLLTSLGQTNRAADHSGEVNAIILSQDILRVAPLHLVPDFLGYILAVGLCVLALLISRTRDDLILAAVVSAAGNYVFLAGLLPVGAMTGFIGQLQLVILMGILYVALADEMIDHQLGRVKPRWAELLRWAVLPSYLLLTLWTIYLIIPSGVLQTS